MPVDTIFLICTIAALPLWLLLIVAPRWRWTWRTVHGSVPFILFALVYVLAQTLGGAEPEGAGFDSLDALILLFSTKEAMLAVWIHFIVTDLFVGSWIVRDAARLGIRHLWIVPSLLLTFALAPIGLMSYLVLRWFRGGGMVLDEKGVKHSRE